MKQMGKYKCKRWWWRRLHSWAREGMAGRDGWEGWLLEGMLRHLEVFARVHGLADREVGDAFEDILLRRGRLDLLHQLEGFLHL